MNFFKRYPALKNHKLIKELIDKYDLNTAEQIMDCVYQLKSAGSDFAEMSEQERKHEIELSYAPLNVKKFDLDNFKEYISLFERVCLTKTEKLHAVWGKSIDEMIVYIGNLKWGEDDDTLFKMNDKMDKTFNMYNKIKDQLRSEADAGGNVGGYEESFIES